MGNKKDSEIQLYRRFIDFVRKGYNALGSDSRNEIKKFMMESRSAEGGFNGRDGRPDAYYSLFGAWLAEALDVTLLPNKAPLNNHKNTETNQIDELASCLLSVIHPEKNFKKPSWIKIMQLTFGGNRQISFFYRFFLFILLCDATGNSRLIRFFIRPALVFFSPAEGAPCSIHAAFLVARHEVSLNTKRQQKLLFSFFEPGQGFKAFTHHCAPDLLSTAAALFALKTTEADLRTVAPDCLNLIQNNYASGAFLAGNGDEVRDLEYTFYGLLALGTLVSNEQEYHRT